LSGTARHSSSETSGRADNVSRVPRSDEAEDTSGEVRPARAKVQDVYRALQRGIQEGRYAGGTRLKEMDLAAELGVSRTPIREAIRLLERDGVVEVIPNRGAAVRSWSVEDVEDVYALRAIIEGFCASLAATRMEPSGISHLVEINDELSRRIRSGETDVEALIRLNAAFHHAIVEGSGSHRVTDVLQQTTEIPPPLKRLFWESSRSREVADVYHHEIMQAIRAHDAVRAEAVMRSHVFAIKDFYVEQQRAMHIQRIVSGQGR
jgi:DNA-binding GntR family transcriptional regulator